MSSDARKRAEEALRSCIRAMSDWAAQEDGLPDTAADAVEEALSALSLLASEPAKGACADCGGCGGLGWILAGDEQLGCIDCNGKGTIEPAPPAGAEVARLTALLRECNAVCLCGCPESEHESYGEDGESCADEGHECIRVAPAVLEIVQRYRVALAGTPAPRPAQDAVKRALVEMRDDLQRLTGSANYGTVIRLTERLTGLIIDIDAAPAQDAVREAAETISRIYFEIAAEEVGEDWVRAEFKRRFAAARAAQGGAEVTAPEPLPCPVCGRQPSVSVREAAETLEPIDTIKVACGTADKADVAQRIGRARVALDAARGGAS